MKRWMILWGLLASCILWMRADAPAAIPADAGAELTVMTKYIALTFDDGPKRGTTDILLDGLQERGVSATFFLVGEQIAGCEDLVLRMQAEGHQVGNHTWSHAALRDASEQTIRRELLRTETLLSKLLGGEDYWVRPPYGLIREEDRPLVPVPMIKWSLDPRDWEKRNTKAVLQAILTAAEPNAIVLLHDIYPTTVEAALKAADALTAQGYTLVTVEELMALNGAKPQAGAMYRNGAGDPAWG